MNTPAGATAESGMQTDQRKLPSLDDVQQTEVRQDEQSLPCQDADPVAADIEQDDSLAPATERPVYVMIPKAFSEGVSLTEEGPRSTTEYSSGCLYETPQTYVARADIVPRLIPKYFITIVRRNDEQDSTITYHERVEFVHTMRIKEFSETVNSFPKEVSSTFVTTLTYIPNYLRRRYVTSLLMEPAQVLTLPLEAADVFSNCTAKNEIAATCTAEAKLVGGDTEFQPVMLLNGTA